MATSLRSATGSATSIGTEMPISDSLITLLRATFRLNWDGIHGAPHWARVRDNGLLLAKATGANEDVIEYFAFMHDACRRSDGHDADHGRRAAQLARAIRNRHIALNNAEFELLVDALSGHTDGTTPGNITVATCWDADRLDLGRVDIVPDPRYLHTEPGRDPQIIQWASERSRRWREQYIARRESS